jgi:putative ABC transport system permease protein
MLNDTSSRQAGIGADIMVQPPGSSLFMGVSGAPVSIKVADKLRQLTHVVAATPVVTVEALNHSFRICGIVEHGKGARKFVPIATLQDLNGAIGKASIFYVKLDDPNDADAVVQAIKAIPGMQAYGVHSLKEYLSLMTSASIPGLTTVINVVIGIAMIIGFIVIFQAMYAAVMERTREIGILKSLGAGKLYIVNVVLRETLLIAIGGIVLGIAISFAAKVGIRTRFQTLPVLITSAWLVKAAIIAMVGSLLGAFYPAMKAAQKDPIDALAYE